MHNPFLIPENTRPCLPSDLFDEEKVIPGVSYFLCGKLSGTWYPWTSFPRMEKARLQIAIDEGRLRIDINNLSINELKIYSAANNLLKRNKNTTDEIILETINILSNHSLPIERIEIIANQIKNFSK